MNGVILDIDLLAASRQETTRLQSGESFGIEVEIDVRESIPDLVVGFLIRASLMYAASAI
jgi:hypothetical protein